MLDLIYGCAFYGYLANDCIWLATGNKIGQSN